jgi:ABC-type Fe3+ transport system substrate-binding protein
MRLDIATIIVVALLAVVAGCPLIFAPRDTQSAADADIIILTPHNEQILYEFEQGFHNWHRQTHGLDISIDWRVVSGGSSDILRQLRAEYASAAQRGNADKGIGIDIVWGGGDYVFSKLKEGARYTTKDGTESSISITQPVELPQELLAEVFPTRMIGSKPLYDPDGHWYGVVLSSFGIVYNRDVLSLKNLPEPSSWSDLARFEYHGWVGLADPSHSGSVRVAYESLIQWYGFEKGFATLRRMFSNARYFTPKSTQVPLDVSIGEIAAGVCVDFYGRSEAATAGDRLHYTTPAGETIVNADPAAILRGAPHPELSKQFIEYLLSEEGQAIFCFKHVPNQAAGTNQRDHFFGSNTKQSTAPLTGPQKYDLCRSPIRPDFYQKYTSVLFDPTDYYAITKPLPETAESYFTVLPVVMHAMVIDIHEEATQAWHMVNNEKDPRIREQMLKHFDALPFTQQELAQTPTRWRNDESQRDQDRLKWTNFFRQNYKQILSMTTH